MSTTGLISGFDAKRFGLTISVTTNLVKTFFVVVPFDIVKRTLQRYRVGTGFMPGNTVQWGRCAVKGEHRARLPSFSIASFVNSNPVPRHMAE